MTHSNSLRIIGQSLDADELQAFELETQGHEYVVKSDYLSERTEWFLLHGQRLDGERWQGYGHSQTKRSIRLNSGDIARLNRQAERLRNLNTYPSARDNLGLSHLLRSVGDFLDRKEAQSFRIRWDHSSISVDFRSPNEHSDSRTFTIERLQKLSSVGKYQRSRTYRYSIKRPKE